MLITQILDLKSELHTLRISGKRIGLVPTMGALHQAHTSLVDAIRNHCDIIVLYIFLNRLQFNAPEDYARYPRNFESDLKVARESGVDIIFAPDESEIYSTPIEGSVVVKAGNMASGLCGDFRPGHFDGVTTVLSKFFNIVQPNVVILGEKDFQQLKVVEQMVADLNFPLSIVSAPLLREADGLAVSSRNSLLSSEERLQAREIYQSLLIADRAVRNGLCDTSQIRDKVYKHLKSVGIDKIDYIEIVDSEKLSRLTKLDTEGRLLLALYVGNVRLIDNIQLFPIA